MRIVKPYAKLMREIFLDREDKTGALEKIEWCSRISHRAEDKQTADSWRRFIQNVVIEHGDWSVVEHVSVSVDALVDRGITHEWVRHRLFSYTQESTRFVNYEKKMAPSFIYPKPDVECNECLNGNEVINSGAGEWTHIVMWGGEVRNEISCTYEPTWLRGRAEDEREYKSLIAKGWRPQEARSGLPNALASRIIVTGNLRNWRHLFIMRTTQETHPQFKQVTIPLLKEFQDTFPILFDDLVPNMKQAESMKKIR